MIGLILYKKSFIIVFYITYLIPIHEPSKVRDKVLLIKSRMTINWKIVFIILVLRQFNEFFMLYRDFDNYFYKYYIYVSCNTYVCKSKFNWILIMYIWDMYLFIIISISFIKLSWVLFNFILHNRVSYILLWQWVYFFDVNIISIHN